MKHLYITNEHETSSGNGIGTYIRQLITCLSGTDIAIGILVFNSGQDVFDIEEVGGIRYFHFPPFFDKSIQNHSRVIDKFLRLYIPDSPDNIFLINYSPCSILMKTIRESHPLSKQIYVIHDMAWTLHLFGDVDRYIRILKQKNRKYVVERYAYLLEAYREEVEMCRYADRVVCLSEDTYRLLETCYSEEQDKLRLIPNALFERTVLWSEKQKKAFRKKMMLPDDEKILLYVGRMTEQKGFMACINAFKEIVKVYPMSRLAVVGTTGNWDFVRKICYPVLAKVHFTGALSSEEVDKWYQISDIGLLPSYTEQCSYVGLEMIAHRLPVVASDGFGVRCMFQKQEYVRVAHIGDINQADGFKDELVMATLSLLRSLDERGKTNIDVTYPNENYLTDKGRRLYLMLFEDC
ncbi:glycosyltransferase [uncultured Parabacteroides sp.]|uniref:glycosyltransferase n=2 Tax=Parabacteroides TaxID=375288 RepID=UPI00262077AD|nr:glycosyltransferase [uncultured Parabacteroides sp.]